MRKTNNLPWMGRTVVVAIMALVGLGAFAGSAQAQGTTFFDFDDAEGWWNYFDCDAMRVILGAGGGGTTDITKASESRACKMFDGLSRDDRRIIEDFIGMSGTFAALGNDGQPRENTKGWWNGNAGAGGTVCVVRQQLVGVLPLDGDGNTDDVQAQTEDSDDQDDQLYCRAYDGTGGLRPAELDMVNAVGMAISGRGGMMTDDDDDDDDMAEAPALPLVGVGLLGLLLAGRGAWLRRRA